MSTKYLIKKEIEKFVLKTEKIDVEMHLQAYHMS